LNFAVTSAQLPDIAAGVAAFNCAEVSCCPPKCEHAEKSATLATPTEKVASVVFIFLSPYFKYYLFNFSLALH
jgi:hypothetical protein